jgi:hypothetical protein
MFGRRADLSDSGRYDEYGRIEEIRWSSSAVDGDGSRDRLQTRLSSALEMKRLIA